MTYWVHAYHRFLRTRRRILQWHGRLDRQAISAALCLLTALLHCIIGIYSLPVTLASYDTLAHNYFRNTQRPFLSCCGFSSVVSVLWSMDVSRVYVFYHVLSFHGFCTIYNCICILLQKRDASTTNVSGLLLSPLILRKYPWVNVDHTSKTSTFYRYLDHGLTDFATMVCP